MVIQDIPAVKLTQILSREMFTALGFTPGGTVTRLFSPFVRKPIHKFSEIAVNFDSQLRDQGFQQASRWILPNFTKDILFVGADSIPTNGPLLVTSNHPGAYDALVIAANLPRDDIKIIVNIPLDFIKELPSTHAHFLYAPLDPYVRLTVVRSAINHLKNGGTLLVFASGGMDPDPASMGGAEEAIDSWSRSLEIFIRKVPQTQVLLSMISGILEPKYVKHVFTHFRKDRRDKQRISEFFQILHQMLRPGKLLQTPRLSFAGPYPAHDLISSGGASDIMAALTTRAQRLLVDHRAYHW